MADREVDFDDYHDEGGGGGGGEYDDQEVNMVANYNQLMATSVFAGGGDMEKYKQALFSIIENKGGNTNGFDTVYDTYYPRIDEERHNKEAIAAAIDYFITMRDTPATRPILNAAKIDEVAKRWTRLTYAGVENDISAKYEAYLKMDIIRYVVYFKPNEFELGFSIVEDIPESGDDEDIPDSD